MHTLELNGKKVLIAPLPSGTIEELHVDNACGELEFLRIEERDGADEIYEEYESIDLPEGSWHLHSTWPEMEEKEAAELHPDRPWIVEPICRTNFIDYRDVMQVADARYRNIRAARESFQTLLESLGLPLTSRYAVLTAA